MYKSFKTLVAMWLVAVMAVGPVAAQQLTETFADEIRSLEEVGAEPLDTSDATVSSIPSVQVHLKDDGSLAGRFRILWPTGKTEPADAQVQFTSSGSTVETVRTDSAGRFSVPGLTPGTYVATASIEAGSTDFNVEVLTYDSSAAPAEMFMDATLTPLPEMVEGAVVMDGGTCGGCGGAVVGGLCSQCGMEVLDPCCEPLCCEQPMQQACGGFSGGGGCGGGCGGGGLGWLLGAAGLAAGLTALALDDDDGGQVSNPMP